jgi:hypothetical protein
MGLLRLPVLMAGLVATTVAMSTFAYAAANVTPATKVGDGSGAITGYTLSAIVYTLNGTDPTLVDEVAFTLNSAPPAGSVIKAKLVAAGTDWYVCANVAAAVTCDTTVPQATAASVDQLRVVVAQ